MNVIDSSGWLEYFGDGPNSDFFADPIKDVHKLIIPTLTVFEVFKRTAQQRGEGNALQAIAVMQQGKVVELTFSLALEAARLSLDNQLPLADSIILATARMHEATLWTQDANFEGMEGVKYIRKKKRRT